MHIQSLRVHEFKIYLVFTFSSFFDNHLLWNQVKSKSIQWTNHSKKESQTIFILIATCEKITMDSSCWSDKTRIKNKKTINIAIRDRTFFKECGYLSNSWNFKFSTRGRVQTTWTNGVAQMTTIINNSYLVKVSTWGGGSKLPKILPTWFVHAPTTALKSA